ncbi:hypothetical protein [Microbacterium sp. OR16]|uniref:hypothetical protein n=1 Tax=Microbacterium sp. OR16 TaxID=3095345 RepID=UPI0039B67A2A
MQLGTRWEAGAEPPASVPAALRPAIAEVESRLSGSLPDGSLSLSNGPLSPSKGHWTLTWLEGRPIAELDAGWEVFLTASGEVVARPFED